MIRLSSVMCLALMLACAGAQESRSGRLKVGAAAVELEADDSMVIGGSIHAVKAKGQEGKLRAVAVVLDHPASGLFAIVACDVLMMNRDLLDAAAAVEKSCGIPFAHVLINCTHTHHAPSTCTVHGYARDDMFSKRTADAVVKAVKDALGRRVEA